MAKNKKAPVDDIRYRKFCAMWNAEKQYDWISRQIDDMDAQSIVNGCCKLRNEQYNKILSDSDRLLLDRQYNAMKELKEILKIRIDLLNAVLKPMYENEKANGNSAGKKKKGK